jgi:branched-chain amino acid transport system substrate-binding protein
LGKFNTLNFSGDFVNQFLKGVYMKLKLTVLAALATMAGVASAQDMQVVKIGHVAPISGAQAAYGKDNENGARMAIEDLNTQNISIGGKKIKFELVAEDDAADPKQGAAAAQKLCDAKVNGVAGHLNSGTTIPASKIYNDCGIPHITPSATNPNLTTKPPSACWLTTTLWALAWLSMQQTA